MSQYMHQELFFFCRSFLAGILLAAVYDIFRIFRNVLSHSSFFINLEDLLYWCSAGLFLFSVIYTQNDGVIRVYALAGISLGALLYHAGPSSIFVKYLSAFLSGLKVLLKIPLKPFNRGRKRLKFWLTRVKISLYEQKSIQKIRKSKNAKKKKEKSGKQDRNA